MTANRRSINDLRYLARNNLIVPDNLDIRRNRTVSYPDSALPLARARTLKILNLPNCLYTKKSCESFQSYEKNVFKNNLLKQISRIQDIGKAFNKGVDKKQFVESSVVCLQPLQAARSSREAVQWTHV